MKLKRPQTLLVFALALLVVSPAWALDDAHWQKANQTIVKGLAYLRKHQNKDGSWTPRPGPAVTGLIVRAMLQRPNIGPNDPTVKKAIAYILSKAKPSGAIDSGILANYNTSICIAALALDSANPKAAEAVAKGQAFLKGLQWHNQKMPDGEKITKASRWYGGAGYGDPDEGRPDMSNTSMMLEGLHASGLSCNDPAFKRALVFITRCQGVKENKMFASKIVPNGGFIYSTSTNDKHVDKLESKAGTVDYHGESLLRTYGSMTYAGFMSYLYANLSHNDPRVQAAYHWAQAHYTLDVNPGMPKSQAHQGQYYYYLAFARALRAWGSSTITTTDGKTHDWANDLIDKLASLQKPNGSWFNKSDRFMEGDPNLVTAYCVLALENAAP